MMASGDPNPQITREYLDFLDDNVGIAEDQWIYHKKVKDMITDGKKRLVVNINDLRRKNPNRASQLMVNGFDEMGSFHRALKSYVDNVDPLYSKQQKEFHIGLEGSFGSRHLTPRTLTCAFLGNMVCVEGIVSKCSLVRPKITHSVHYCPATKKMFERSYSDMTSLEAFPSSGVYPTKDDDGNLLETEFGLSVYVDHQMFSIQEMPEKAPAGQLPRSVDVIVDDDLVDLCKPGDRIQVIALYRCLPSKKNSYSSCTFRTILISNNIQLLNREIQPTFSATDISKIKKFSRQKDDVFEVLAHSLAPTIHGHEYIKKAILCMLLGGVEKVLDNGTRIRGDINLLLIGDPSVAKSQLLRYVLHTAPRAVTTTGRGSSGVGLTAAVTTDHETGERRLEAGAMVLADRGVVCIDEFDKMSDMDRTAIHEVMEQGRVTIAKAGIHAKLNARCSVLAAANPVYGRYNQYKTPMENIGLQDSLLSRFDLLFIILDVNDRDNDRMISDHILRIHRYRSPNEQDGDALPLSSSLDLLMSQSVDDEAAEEEEDTPIYDKFNSYLGNNKKKEKYVSMKFMRKYLHVAKEIKPAMTRDASDYIAQEFTKLRNHDMVQDNVARTQPITARSLETMIRLSAAHAKCRLSKTIDVEDAQAALELVHFAYFKKVLKKTRKRRQSASSEGDSGDEVVPSHTKQQKRKRTETGEEVRPEEEESEDPYSFSNLDRDEGGTQPQSKRPRIVSQDPVPGGSSTRKEISEQRLEQFKASLEKMFRTQHVQSLLLEDVAEFVNKENEKFSVDELYSAIDKMQEQNHIMLSDNIIFLI